MIPVYNDWGAVAILLPLLDRALAEANRTADVLLIDDGSSSTSDSRQWPEAFQAIGRLEILTLRRNLGHQRAIAVGLAFIEAQRQAEAVVLMDGDGEDNPQDIPRLLDRCAAEGHRKIVFAERTKRSESLAFRIGYKAYLFVHNMLVGPVMRIGNFSVIPRSRLRSLVTVSELWSHYAAAAVQSRQPIVLEPTARAKRLQGRSSMNYAKLVIHGLTAVSVYSDTVGIRLLAASCGLIVGIVAGLTTLVTIRLTTDYVVPDWILFTLGVLAILLCVAAMFSLSFSFLILGGRSALSFLPSRDYIHFVGEVRALDLHQSHT